MRSFFITRSTWSAAHRGHPVEVENTKRRKENDQRVFLSRKLQSEHVCADE
jgi:hypothetical protein